MPFSCVDDAGWNNLHGKSCADYAAYCDAGAFRLGASWAGGEVFNFPERSCCACGKTPSEVVPAKPAPLFEKHVKSFCRGTDHEVKLKDEAACEAHCHPDQRPCACFHFNKGVCHFGFTYVGLQTSTKSSTAWVKTSALIAAPKTTMGPPNGAACVPLPPRRVPPTFYLYNDAPFAWGPRLAACFASRQGVPPWAFAVNDTVHQTDGAPPPGVAYGLWLAAALANHPQRVATPEEARIFVVPAYGSLSENVGGCEGTTHAQRQDEAAKALQASPWFARFPQRHVLLASSGSEDDRNPLGALGSLASKHSMVPMCVDRDPCAAGFKKKAVVPPMPLLPLVLPSTRARVGYEACANGGGARRRASVYFRGRHAKDDEASALRSRLWALRELPGADVKFVSGGGDIKESSRSWLKAHGWSKDVRVPYSAATYASGVSHADFCIIAQEVRTRPSPRPRAHVPTCPRAHVPTAAHTPTNPRVHAPRAVARLLRPRPTPRARMSMSMPMCVCVRARACVCSRAGRRQGRGARAGRRGGGRLRAAAARERDAAAGQAAAVRHLHAHHRGL